MTLMREQMPQPLRAITTVPSVRDLAYFPFSMLGRMLPERRRRGAAGHGRGRRTGDHAAPAAPRAE